MADSPTDPIDLAEGAGPATQELLELGLLHLSDLQHAGIEEVRSIARALGIEKVSGVKKSDLIFAILQEYVGKRGVMFGEGVVEVLPDGFGFLRSADYSFQPSADDIYLGADLVANTDSKAVWWSAVRSDHRGKKSGTSRC